MKLEKKIILGKVDRKKEHIKIILIKDLSKYILAKIAPENSNKIILEFESGVDDHYKARVEKEIKYLLFDLDRNDPWKYAVYHCNTASNIYSDIQWQYYNQKV
ncbi:MAG: hypothetical protein CMF23_18200 [Ignavibacteriae bacterium]|nr:hypothetical protein [Ignavibacteriota bacterium]